MEIEMEFGRFPNFLGNERASEMETASFGVRFKIFVVKLFLEINGVSENVPSAYCRSKFNAHLKLL
ncbi:hypothetical protein [Gramella sp. AN32]|uniref:Uncharacterized protein n=1 Tax=Christiangramia antarctica TaxID=2058158 RepID=A0ABW5XA29_9FLAO|nr:hypothetical protein [Gramella sp. AN32]MCM4157580.1 hypothetical protein [Gramella sp. AN32]